MKLNAISILSLTGILTLTIFACQAQQSDTVDSSMIELIYADPLAQESRDAMMQTAQLITYGKVDLEPIREVINATPNSCEALLQDLSHIKGAHDYLAALCTLRTSREKIAEKYPDFKDLPSETRSHILFGNPPEYSDLDIHDMIISRSQPDRK